MNTQQKIEEKALKTSMPGAFILAVWGLVIAREIHPNAQTELILERSKPAA